jgi:diguanylate cyclase (GGDEF)-like protein/PAS domain S-box-containing protein
MRKAQGRQPRPRGREPGGELKQIQSAALEAVAAAIIVTDREGTIVWANPALEELSGYKVQELIGQNPRVFKSGRQPTSFYRQMWETILAGQRWQGELLNQGKEGKVYWEEMAITPVRSAQGEITHFVAIQCDISEQKSIRERIHLLAQAMESTSEMIGVTDREGHFLFVNRAFEQAIGCTAKEVVGRHFTLGLSAKNPASLQSEIAREGMTPGGWKGECLVPRSDGTDFPAFLSITPIQDEEGHAVGMVGIAQDISERKAAEEKLRQSEEQFRQIGENISSALFILTPEPPRINYLNRAYETLWGKPRQEVYDRTEAWLESVHPEDRRRMLEIFRQTLQGAMTEAEFRLVRPDGSVRWVDGRTFPVTDSAGRLSRIVGIVQDITRRKEAESELQEAHEKLGAALRDAEQRAVESAKLTELVDLLQSCQRVEEAYQITESILPRMLPARSGALCITSASRNVIEAVAEWGEEPASQRSFRPNDCWALRRGKIHAVTDPASAPRCAHLSRLPEGGYLCVPLSAHGETLGILYLESPLGAADSSNGAEAAVERLAPQAAAAGERISLALANLQLREALRRQSIHDPLTGLFNRRYMEESLERELSRATRNGQSVALLMLDIDNFKAFNDTFGHQAGDTLLRAFGNFLNQRTRGQDVACRYGGEEFAVILSEASLEGALQRAKLLQEELSQLVVEHAGQVLGKVTLSIGVAAFPDHGRTTEDLLRSADDALYRAKTAGRDRIIAG